MGAVFVVKNERARSQATQLDVTGLGTRCVLPLSVRRIDPSWIIIDYAIISPPEELQDSKLSVLRMHMQRLAPYGTGITLRSDAGGPIRLSPYTYTQAREVASQYGLLADSRDHVRSSVGHESSLLYADVYGVLYRCDLSPELGSRVVFRFDRSSVGVYRQPLHDLVLSVLSVSEECGADAADKSVIGMTSPVD